MPDLPARPSDAAAYFAAATEAFEEAAGLIGGPEHAHLQIGPKTLTLEFAGPSLRARLLPALAHHLTEQTESADLRVRVWDTGTSGIDLPTSPWSEGSYEARGSQFDFSDGRVLYRDDRFRMYFFQASDAVLLDFQKGEAVCWFRDAETIPYYESGAPLRALLQWWLEPSGLIVVHAAAVGLPSGGVLLAGRGGSGKSTTALLCLSSELLYASDDYCLVGAGNEPYVHSLYNTGKVDANTLTHVPHLAKYVENRDKLESEKALIFLHEHLPQKLIRQFPIRALLIPQVTGDEESRITPTTKADGLRALAPSTIFQQAGSGDGSFGPMTHLDRTVPVYRLLLGSNTAAIPNVIHHFINNGFS